MNGNKDYLDIENNYETAILALKSGGFIE